ncbi:YqzE family protein [Gorillibacterium massiliense]|uniref:YqzE family protein n=1 Tax=Gorillibacterium massiliense TaxID=1280390 RepID=UPI0004B6C9CE|nr:YqzE family protein [Gorillibacterium massiliense]
MAKSKSKKGDELLLYVTERVVEFANTPRSVRKEARSHRPVKEPWSVRWFGMLPLSIKIWRNSRHK